MSDEGLYSPPLDRLKELGHPNTSWHWARGERDYVAELGLTEAEVDEQIEARLQARQEKDFSRADQIRDELAEKGVELLDSPQGTTWKIK